MQMYQRTWKLMATHKALHSRDNVDTLYESRNGEGRGLTSIDDNVDALIQWLKVYTEKHEGGMITTIRIETENTMANRCTITRKQKWEEKQFYRHLKQVINNILHENTWT